MFCPQCHVDYRDGSTVCPACRVALVGNAPYLNTLADFAAERDDRRHNRSRGWQMIAGAYALYVLALAAIPWGSSSVFALKAIICVGAFVILVLGCSKVATSKGYGEGYGALALLGVIGVVALAVMKEKDLEV